MQWYFVGITEIEKMNTKVFPMSKIILYDAIGVEEMEQSC